MLTTRRGCDEDREGEVKGRGKGRGEERKSKATRQQKPFWSSRRRGKRAGARGAGAQRGEEEGGEAERGLVLVLLRVTSYELRVLGAHGDARCLSSCNTPLVGHAMMQACHSSALRSRHVWSGWSACTSSCLLRLRHLSAETPLMHFGFVIALMALSLPYPVLCKVTSKEATTRRR